jgi:hypothetical protein
MRRCGEWTKVDGVDTVDGSGRSHRKGPERKDVHYVYSVHSVDFRLFAVSPYRRVAVSHRSRPQLLGQIQCLQIGHMFAPAG